MILKGIFIGILSFSGVFCFSQNEIKSPGNIRLTFPNDSIKQNWVDILKDRR
jgi:hypothetical protein